MTGKPPVDVIAGHLLSPADSVFTLTAQVAFAAGDHGGYDDWPAQPICRLIAGGNDMAADLVAQYERQRLIGLDTIVVKAQIRMAYAAAGDFDGDLPGWGWRQRQYFAL